MKLGARQIQIAELRRVCNIAFDKDLIDTHSGNISLGIGKDLLITKTGKSLIDLKPEDFTVEPIFVPKLSMPDNAYNTGHGNKTKYLWDKAAKPCEASSEIDIHRFILNSFTDSAIFHAHPINAIALSLLGGGGVLKSPEGKSAISKLNGGKRYPIAFSAIQKNKSDTFSNTFSATFFDKKLYKKYPDLKIITLLDFEMRYFFPHIFVFPLKFIDDIKAKDPIIDFEAKDIFKENGIFMVGSHGSFAWGKTPLEALRWTMMLEASAKIILKVMSATI